MRIRKYILFTSLIPLLMDAVDFIKNGKFFLLPPIMSIIATSVFVVIYFSVNFYFKLKLWRYDLIVVGKKLFVVNESVEYPIGVLHSLNLIGDRVLEIVTDNDVEFKLKNGYIDLVFHNREVRDAVYQNILKASVEGN